MLKKIKKFFLFLLVPTAIFLLQIQIIAMEHPIIDEAEIKQLEATVAAFEPEIEKLANDKTLTDAIEKLEKEQNEPGFFQKFNEKVLYEYEISKDSGLKLGLYVNDLLKLGLQGAKLVVEIIFHKRITTRINQHYFDLLTKNADEIIVILNSQNPKAASVKLKKLHKMSLKELAKSGIMAEVLLYLLLYKLIDAANNMVQMQFKTPTFNSIIEQAQKDHRNPPTPEELKLRREQMKPFSASSLTHVFDYQISWGNVCRFFGISYFGDNAYWLFARDWTSICLFVWRQNNHAYANEWAEQLLSKRKQITLLLQQYTQTQKESTAMFLNNPEITRKEIEKSRAKINSILNQIHHTSVVYWVAEKWIFCAISNKAFDVISALPVLYSVTKNGIKFYNDAKPKPITGATT